MAPIDPRPNRWRLPDPERADRNGLAGVGADLEPGTLLAAYRAGLFPMPMRRKLIGWWSPDPRGIIALDGLHVSRSLRRTARRFTIRLDTAFRSVVLRCADPHRPHGWITPAFVDAYERLHELGWAMSVEVFDGTELVGGLYGVRINHFFAGESMFHRATDASKVALMATVDHLRSSGVTLFDVQWTTPHLVSMGAIDIARSDYLARLAEATQP